MKWRGMEEGQAGQGHATLKAALEERLELMQRYVPAETQALNRRAVEELKASGMESRALPVGATAPGFQLPDQDGKMAGYGPTSATSGPMWGTEPFIVIFFRGRWCPFDVAQLEAWNEVEEVVLVGISPQTQHQSFLMREQHKLGFPLLCDAGNAVARQFGLVYRVPAYQQEIYRRTFVNLPFINGDDSWELPIPATYVIGRDGVVLYAAADADYTLRAEPGEVIRGLAF